MKTLPRLKPSERGMDSPYALGKAIKRALWRPERPDRFLLAACAAFGVRPAHKPPRAIEIKSAAPDPTTAGPFILPWTRKEARAMKRGRWEARAAAHNEIRALFGEAVPA